MSDFAILEAQTRGHRSQNLRKVAASSTHAGECQAGRRSRHEVIDEGPLQRLPEPSPGDLFFDYEGDPLFDDGVGSYGSLEYLWGFVMADRNPRTTSTTSGPTTELKSNTPSTSSWPWWKSRRMQFPDMHIYHYAPYEITALKRLSGAHGRHQELLDELLRDGVFVDLYRTVRNSLCVSQPSYSIKYLEPFYSNSPREGAVTKGDDSVAVVPRVPRAARIRGRDLDSEARQASEGPSSTTTRSIVCPPASCATGCSHFAGRSCPATAAAERESETDSEESAQPLGGPRELKVPGRGMPRARRRPRPGRHSRPRRARLVLASRDLSLSPPRGVAPVVGLLPHTEHAPGGPGSKPQRLRARRSSRPTAHSPFELTKAGAALQGQGHAARPCRWRARCPEGRRSRGPRVFARCIPRPGRNRTEGAREGVLSANTGGSKIVDQQRSGEQAHLAVSERLKPQTDEQRRTVANGFDQLPVGFDPLDLHRTETIEKHA